MKTSDLSSDDIGTIRLALTSWALRCEQRAMETTALASTMHDQASRVQCLRNAKASVKFADEARELLKKL